MNDSASSTLENEFLAAYEEYSDVLFRFALRKVSNREQAVDIVQDTFMRAWDSARTGTEVKAWKPFLFRIAYNRIVDTYRAGKTVSLDILVDEYGFDVPTREAGPEVYAEYSRVRAAMDALPETHREVVLLRCVEELPPREIAELTGLTENVVSVRIHRGLALVRAALHADRVKSKEA